MRSLLIGTHNAGKTKEIGDLLCGSGFAVINLKEFPAILPAEETGETLEENAILKAQAYAKETGLLTLSDDSGLEVESLGGAPGVYSARFAGEGCSYEDNNRLLLEKLAGVEKSKRKARFRSVIAIYDPESGESAFVEGVLEGEISESLIGKNGFGYDPVFYVPVLNKTLAELSLEEKNKISHRSQALQKAKRVLLDHWK